MLLQPPKAASAGKRPSAQQLRLYKPTVPPPVLAALPQVLLPRPSPPLQRKPSSPRIARPSPQTLLLQPSSLLEALVARTRAKRPSPPSPSSPPDLVARRRPLAARPSTAPLLVLRVEARPALSRRLARLRRVAPHLPPVLRRLWLRLQRHLLRPPRPRRLPRLALLWSQRPPKPWLAWLVLLPCSHCRRKSHETLLLAGMTKRREGERGQILC